MRIIGIDAALALTGWAVIEDSADERRPSDNEPRLQLLDWGVIETEPGDRTGRAEFQRLRVLYEALCEIIHLNATGRPGSLRVAIERPDWQPGQRGDRPAWIREAKARGALGLGLATCYAACMHSAIEPQVIGVREWMAELESKNKGDTAVQIARLFPAAFQVSAERQKFIVREAHAPCAVVPDHVTDAVAVAYVAIQRLRFAQRVQQAR